MKKLLLIAFICYVTVYSSIQTYNHYLEIQIITAQNICQDEELIARLVSKNINPFNKLNFLVKRNDDCKTLLANSTKDAQRKTKEICTVLDSSKGSVLTLINTYIKDLYDREQAARELKIMVKLMTPYDYCDQYYDTLVDMVIFKKKFAL
ncbi:MAG: hypothetical protein R3Y28_02115 [Candidatus Gastranaerophilales bacterium]